MAAEETATAGVEEVHILWISEGMSCDGDSVSITAAGQPSIEDVVLGVIPGLPKVHLHNKVLAYETGEDFLAAFRKAARGELEPFVLVIEGSIPNEKINGDHATLEFRNQYNGWESLPFVREDGVWKIDKAGYAEQMIKDIEKQQHQAFGDAGAPPEGDGTSTGGGFGAESTATPDAGTSDNNTSSAPND